MGDRPAVLWLRESGNVAEAEQLYRATEGRIDTVKQRLPYINIQIGVGRILTGRGETAKARVLLEHAVAMTRQRFGDEHWRTAEAKLALGECLAASGQAASADSLLRGSYAVLQKERGQPLLAREARLAIERRK